MTGEIPLDEAAKAGREASAKAGREASAKAGREANAEVGGEAACWAHLVCPQCGAMESEGHQQGCPAAPALPADQRH